MHSKDEYVHIDLRTNTDASRAMRKFLVDKVLEKQELNGLINTTLEEVAVELANGDEGTGIFLIVGPMWNGHEIYQSKEGTRYNVGYTQVKLTEKELVKIILEYGESHAG